MVPLCPLPRRRAFALPELLVVVATLLTVTAAGFAVVRGTVASAADTKLRADVSRLNHAIDVYLVHGGSLADIQSPEEVLEKLKTVATDAGGRDAEIIGLRRSMLDPRARAYRSGEGLRTGGLRAFYNASRKHFELSSATSTGSIAAFSLTAPAKTEEVKEERATLLRGSRDAGWVWGYGDAAPPARHLRDTAAVAANDPSGPDAPLLAAAGLTTAQPPLFNPPLPPAALAQYPLTVTVMNPNPPGSTQIYYSLNGGGYVPHAASLSSVALAAPPGTTIQAVAVSLDPDHVTDSAPARQTYAPEPVLLTLADTAPAAVNYFQAGGPAAAGSPAPAVLPASTISLTGAGDIPARFTGSGFFQVEWSFAGVAANSAPFSGSYPGESFTITRDKFPGGSPAALSYRAVPLAPALFRSPGWTSKSVGITRLTLAAPKSSTAGNVITLSPDLAGGSVPANSRLYYNFDSDPGDNGGEPARGTLYTTPITAPAAGGTLYTRVYPPADSKPWFNTSPAATLAVPAQTTNYMGDFNVIAFSSLYTTTAIEGKAWVGGMLTNTGSFSLGRNYLPASAENVAVIGGALGGGNPFQMEGNASSRLALTSAANRGTRAINWNGGGNEASRLVYDTGIPARTLTMQTDLQGLSAKLATATATSTLVTPANQGNRRVLTCMPNASGVAVFNVPATFLFGAANLAEVSLDFATGVSESSVKAVLINVTGTTVQTARSSTSPADSPMTPGGNGFSGTSPPPPP